LYKSKVIEQKPPLISIIIPVYNRLELIGETLETVLVQTYTNWECIIVDDGSTDDSQLIINQYCKRDVRFKFYQRPETKAKGASSCRNFGFEKSKGDLIQFLDSDDLLDNNKLNEQLKLYSPIRNVDLITCKWGWFRNVNRLNDRFKTNYYIYKDYKKGSKLLSDFGYYNSFFPPHVYLTSRELIIMAGGWNESLTNNDDAEFFTRVILKAKKILFAENAKVFYRISNTNKLSELNTETKVISAIKSWKLIESIMKEKDPNSSIKYVRNAKFNLYNSIKNSFPVLLSREIEFFKDRKNYNTYFYQFYKKYKLIPFSFFK
jgi:glycosyltransferase involved in cell wall biosynthesis